MMSAPNEKLGENGTETASEVLEVKPNGPENVCVVDVKTEPPSMLAITNGAIRTLPPPTRKPPCAPIWAPTISGNMRLVIEKPGASMLKPPRPVLTCGPMKMMKLLSQDL